MQAKYSLLLDKLHGFIRRYYVDKILRGGLIFLTGIGSLFLLLVLGEYVAYFGTATRTILYYSFLIFSLFVFIYFFVIPILGLMKIGKSLTMEEAAVLLGRHFKNDVDDKILNTLQLKKLLDSRGLDDQLIIAGIEQKSEKLITFPFARAVDLRKNVRFIPAFLLVLVIILSGWVMFPLVFKDPATRLINHNQVYERPAPFSIIFQNDLPLTAVKNQQFSVKVRTEGNVVPNELEVYFKGKAAPMSKLNNGRFDYNFRNVGEQMDFYIVGSGYTFGPYRINIINRPVIKNFIVKARYPSYTGMGEESFNNIGDISIPEGTELQWLVFTEDTDGLNFYSDSVNGEFVKLRNGSFELTQEVKSSFQYQVKAWNNDNPSGDSLSYFLRSIADNYPGITVQEHQDSVMLSHLLFKGLITDDYGFTRLSYHYRIFEEKLDEKKKPSFSRNAIPFKSNELTQDFYYHVNLNELQLKPGLSMEYYFEVADNDGINGAKATRSQLFSLSVPGYDELIANTISSDEEVKSGLSDNIKEIQDIQQEIDKLRRAMVNSENVTWEQQQNLRDLLDKQQRAQEQFEKLKEFSQNNNTRQEQFNPQDEKIRKKQEELEKLFDEVLSDELKQLYQQIQEELEKLNREKAFDLLNQMEFEMKDLEERLDRALELFKQLQVERMLSDAIKSTERIKDQQNSLQSESKQSDNIVEEQKDVKEQFDNLRKLLDDMAKKNNELSRPNNFDDTDNLEQNISNEMNRAIDQLEKANPGGAQQPQKNASEQLQQLQSQLSQMQARMEQENLAEDIRTLREILDNLIKTSFYQEKLMEDVKEINIRDPKYVSLIQQQRKISNDLVLIKDSLQALAKRQVQIESVVSREISDINLNIEQAIDHLVNRRKHTGITRQQFVMTHVNNLALLLNESMQNMQNQMQGQSGQGQPQSGSGAEGMQDLRQMQEQMNKMLEQLREGHQPEQGQSGEPSSMGMSERLARMAAEQESIRKRLGELNKSLGKDGSKINEIDQLMQEMEKTEMDIVTNNISRQTQLRQQRIVTRMLEHEKALMEREQESRRVGETAKVYDLSNPEEFFEYNRNKNRAIDMLRSMPPGFKPHYKSLVELYFLNVQE
jgi:hypothetical protein